MSGRKLKMFISNGNNHNSNLFALRSKVLAKPAPKPASTSLKNSMISRIHNTTSGCSSCGGKKAY